MLLLKMLILSDFDPKNAILDLKVLLDQMKVDNHKEKKWFLELPRAIHTN